MRTPLLTRRTRFIGIDASTSGVKVLRAGLVLFPSLVSKILKAHGIEDLGTGEQERWFPLDTWLGVHEAVFKEIGPNAVFKLGTGIMENPKFPAWIRDIDGAIASIDIAYHKSHRKNGAEMYDEETGEMLEGIGHYRPLRTPGARRIEVVCDTPYICEVELGIVTGVAQRFDPKVRVAHAPGTCRHNADPACCYVVTW